jgi:glycosyltransferase involved in cell wall biosynthesis
VDLSFIFPCLNEEETLAACIDEVRHALDENTDIEFEIIVADNGSTDRSREIAEHHGARVVDVATRGYGAAIKGGIRAATGRLVAFADADGSYRLEDIGALVHTALDTDADMVIASRMRGVIEPGAMPALHRYLGTPVLTFLINVLFRGHLSDCNSGFRLLKRECAAQWHVRADGMEFASELLIKALKARSTIVEVPSGLRPDRRTREPHLRTWRDGMRHLLFIFSERPELFEWSGLFLVLVTSLLQVVAYFFGLTNILGFHVFDYHTQALLIPVGALGIEMVLFSCFLYAGRRGGAPSWLTRKAIEMDEAHVLLLLVAVGIAVVAGYGFVLWRWRQADFAYLDMIRFILFMAHFLTILGFAGFGLLGIHVLKKGAS